MWGWEKGLCIEGLKGEKQRLGWGEKVVGGQKNGCQEEKLWRSGRKAMGQWIWVKGIKMRKGRQGRGERLRNGGRGEKYCRKMAVGTGN